MTVKILNFKYGLALVLFLFLLSMLGLNSYQGSSLYYFTFDIIWLAVLFSAFCCSQMYVICYIQIMLFLGFWVKLMAHLILGVFFVEPTGYWTAAFANPEAWDQVLLTSSLAAFGVLLANLLSFLGMKKSLQRKDEFNIPQWYLKHSNFLWYFLVLLGIAMNIINSIYHISVTGLRPQLVLPFHLNALMIWSMVIVVPLCMATFLGWERDPEQKKKRFYWVCFMAFITTLSVLSRAIYIFWTLPYLLILFSSSGFSLRRLSLWENRRVIFTYLTFAVLSLILVSIIRAQYYTADTENSKEIAEITTSQLEERVTEKRFSNQLKKLFVGRWVGLEAVMATTAYPQSSWTFFKNSVLEKPSVGDVGCYTRYVLKLNKYVNATPKTMFSSLPGLVGILNYAHSSLLVFLGMFGVCFLLCSIERISFFMLENKLVLSQLGLILGYWCVSGLNIPYLGFINLLECLFVLLLLKLIDPCYNWVMKYWSKRSFPARA
ncbi:hypothetical protein Lsan_2502 [Legionella santicrucis]|uniref:Uncharacterized protein n=1 Tax=Legionella santicrucis TaxID=45074 RepID=A0A0W0YLJ5_9GAMM|nr:hypothetical protein [Legionella santicrucis]KTD57757.1 hypothetical protein Lsan_2502 [Legionella santicrucis]